MERTTFARLCTKAENDIDTETNRSPSSEKNTWFNIEKDHIDKVVITLTKGYLYTREAEELDEVKQDACLY